MLITILPCAHARPLADPRTNPPARRDLFETLAEETDRVRPEDRRGHCVDDWTTPLSAPSISDLS